MRETYGELSSNSHVMVATVGVEIRGKVWTTQWEKGSQGKTFLHLRIANSTVKNMTEIK